MKRALVGVARLYSRCRRRVLVNLRDAGCSVRYHHLRLGREMSVRRQYVCRMKRTYSLFDVDIGGGDYPESDRLEKISIGTYLSEEF